MLHTSAQQLTGTFLRNTRAFCVLHARSACTKATYRHISAYYTHVRRCYHLCTLLHHDLDAGCCNGDMLFVSLLHIFENTIRKHSILPSFHSLNKRNEYRHLEVRNIDKIYFCDFEHYMQNKLRKF